jgi:hypothetical protein
MNHLIVKTKGRNAEFVKVISDEIIFNLPGDLANNVEYQADHNLDEDSWFAIEEFSTKEYCIEFIRKRFITADYNQITRVQYNNLDFLCSYQTGIYYFQKISTRQILRRKYITFSNEPVLVENEPILIIDEFPDAIYVRADDILYFKKLSSITTIFNGIETLYREATDVETETFLNSDFIQLTENYSTEKVKKANRKRIAMAMATLSQYTPVQKQDIFNYIREYCEDLVFDENDENFTISSEDELKKLLYGIEQRYYTTLQGGQRRLANSITTL